MIAWAAGFLLPVAAAIVLLRRAVPAQRRRAIAMPAIGIAMGLASAIGFALMAGGVRSRIVFLALDSAVWLAIIAALALLPRTESAPARAPTKVADGRPFSIAVVVVFVATLAIAVLWFVATSGVYPHGEWDAWAQWNLRARFFFRGFADGTWRDAFAPVLAWSHADYPMLVPMSVARLWLYGGTETVAAPIAFGGFMAAATVIVAMLGAADARGWARGALAGAVILACPSFVRYSAAQCADVALGFYLLCAFVLWSRAADEPRQPVYWVLAGTAAALAGWTKNEGLAGFGLFVLAVACERWWSWRSVRPAAIVLGGAMPVLIVIAIFKLTLAPPSYFTSEQSLARAAANLIDGDRIRLVAEAFAEELWRTGGTIVGVVPLLAAFAVARGIDPQPPAAARVALAAVMLLLAVYAAAYLVTPKDLAWQLQTSLDRLVLHAVPTLAWAIVTASR